jgi:hypothetical protein
MAASRQSNGLCERREAHTIRVTHPDRDGILSHLDQLNVNGVRANACEDG